MGVIFGGRTMARPANVQPTDGELEILKVLWGVGPAELGKIRGGLGEAGRPVAASTVATMLKVMLRKGLVRREGGPRGSLWSATVSRESTASGMLGKVLDHVFDGSAGRLVAHLLDRRTLEPGDREAIRRLLDEHEARDGGPTP